MRYKISSIKDPVKSFSDKITATSRFKKTDLSINNVRCKNITIQVTEECNLRCSYCYEINKKPTYLKLESACKFIDDLLDNVKLKSYCDINNIEAYIFDFIGGEPFLCLDLIDNIMDYWVNQVYIKNYESGKRYMISMASNGTLYFTEKAQKFIDKWKDHLSLSITVDGNKELHDACRLFPDGKGSFDLAWSAAKDQLIKYNNSSTKLTFSPENINKMSSAIINMIDNGWTSIHGNCCFEKGWTLNDAKIFYKELKILADYLLQLEKIPYVSLFDENIGHYVSLEDDNKNWCGGCGLMLSLGPDDNYYPCLRYMPSSMPEGVEPYSIGDLDHGIGNLQVHSNRVRELSNITRESQSDEKCIKCSINGGCAWCSAYNYTIFGTPNKRATFICDMHKARVLANVYFWNKFYKKYKIDDSYDLDLSFDDQDIVDWNEYNFLLSLSGIMRG